MDHSLTSILFPEYRRRVLGLLLLRPELALHGREVSRQTGLPPGATLRELNKLVEVGLLTKDKRGNQQIFSANTASPIYAELASILRKTSGVADVLRDALAPLQPKLRAAFIFGSVAQGRETAGSDIDLMLIGDVGFREAVELLHPTQAMLGREVNVQVFSADEFAAQARAQPYMADALAKQKIFLKGDEDELAELGGHQP